MASDSLPSSKNTKTPSAWGILSTNPNGRRNRSMPADITPAANSFDDDVPRYTRNVSGNVVPANQAAFEQFKNGTKDNAIASIQNSLPVERVDVSKVGKLEMNTPHDKSGVIKRDIAITWTGVSLQDLATNPASRRREIAPVVFKHKNLGESETTSYGEKRGGDLTAVFEIGRRVLSVKNGLSRRIGFIFDNDKGKIHFADGNQTVSFFAEANDSFRYPRDGKDGILKSKKKFLRAEILQQYSQIKTRQDILHGCNHLPLTNTYMVPLATEEFGPSHILRVYDNPVNYPKLKSPPLSEIPIHDGVYYNIQAEVVDAIADSIMEDVVEERKFANKQNFGITIVNVDGIPFNDVDLLSRVLRSTRAAEEEINTAGDITVVFNETYCVAHGDN